MFTIDCVGTWADLQFLQNGKCLVFVFCQRKMCEIQEKQA